MQNRITIKELFSKATDINFRNLFQPVIPHLDLTGKIAQVISALTEAVTVWFICQSELSEVNKYLTVFISIIAVLLVVAAIELGGRKGVQVLTRAIVWKRLKSFWYWILFIPILLITGFLFWQSFQLSTKGTNQTFKQSVRAAVVFNDSTFFDRHQLLTATINAKLDQQIGTIGDAHKANYSAKENEFNVKIEGVTTQIAQHKRNKANGVKWAQSHIDKQTKIKSSIETEKAQVLALLTADYNANIKSIEDARVKELTLEGDRYKEAIEEAKGITNTNRTTETETANFWGGLFSNLVGLMIVIALVCIIIVEIFRKGSGIEIEYLEGEAPPTLWVIFWQGVNNRAFNVSYKMVNKVYVEKKAFTFDFIQPTLSEYQKNTMSINRKHDLPLLFNTGIDIDNNIQFSANAKDGKVISATIEANTTSTEDLDNVDFSPSNDLTNELLGNNNQRMNSMIPEGMIKCALDGCNECFVKRNHRHKFHSSDCRIKHWEQKTGQEFGKEKIE